MLFFLSAVCLLCFHYSKVAVIAELRNKYRISHHQPVITFLHKCDSFEPSAVTRVSFAWQPKWCIQPFFDEQCLHLSSWPCRHIQTPVVLQLVKPLVTVKQRHRFKAADTVTQRKVSRSCMLGTDREINSAHLQFLCCVLLFAGVLMLRQGCTQ